jgi:HSP20 family protein
MPVGGLISAPNKVITRGLFRTLRAGNVVEIKELKMNIRRYQPWSLFDLIERDLSPFTGRQTALTDATNTAADWVPAVDIVEERDKFVLKADVPGVDPTDIDVSMDAGVLSLSGERRSETNDGAEGLKLVERNSGRFFRRFTLPETADAEGVTAKGSNGILEITVPKQPEIQARRITVEAA